MGGKLLIEDEKSLEMVKPDPKYVEDPITMERNEARNEPKKMEEMDIKYETSKRFEKVEMGDIRNETSNEPKKMEEMDIKYEEPKRFEKVEMRLDEPKHFDEGMQVKEYVKIMPERDRGLAVIQDESSEYSEESYRGHYHHQKDHHYRKPRKRRQGLCLGGTVTTIAIIVLLGGVILTTVLFRKSGFSEAIDTQTTSIIANEGTLAPTISRSPSGVTRSPVATPAMTPQNPNGEPSASPTVKDATWVGIGRLINDKYKRISQALLSGDGMSFAVLFPNFTSKPAVVQVIDITPEGLFQRGSDIVADEDNLDDSILAMSLSEDGSRIAVSYKQGNFGYVQVYRFILQDWISIGERIQSGVSKDNFGATIALSGDGKRLAVASIQDDDSKGIVRIYDFDGDDWVLNPTSPKGEKNGDLFGIAIDINQDGSKVVVVYNAQSPFDSTLEYIQVFAIDSLNNWILWGDLIQRNPPNPAFYTNSISLSDDGEVLAVTFGPVGNELSKTMVFDFSPNQKWIPRDNDLVGDGVSLAGDGNNVVVTTYSDKTSTAYKWRSDSWIQMGWTFPGIAKVESTSGVSMSTDGTRFMISEHLTMNPNVGLRSRVRLFHYG